MVKMGFKIMDSDMHVMEPVDLWQRYIEPAFKERAPKCFQKYQRDQDVEVEGHILGGDPVGWGAAKAIEQEEIYADPYENNWDAPSQVRAMDKEGVDITVLYPSRGLSVIGLQMDPALGAAIARAYNNWMYDFVSYAPNRMYGAGMLAPFDVESAVEEVHRSVKDLKFRGIFMRPNIVNGRNWHDPCYDPLWAEIESLEVPIGFHEGANALLPQIGDRFKAYWTHHTCCHSMEMMVAVVSLIGGGVLERFPGLRVGFLEANCSWAPWLLWRLNEHYELSGRFESPELKLEPSEYFQRQCYVSIEPDEEPARFIEQTGLVNNLVFSTDYPHNDAKYPYAIDTLLEMPFSEDAKRKILWDNCAKLYGFS